MKRNQPQLRYPLIFSALAGFAWTVSGYTTARLTTSIAYILTFVMIAGVIFSGLDWLTFTVARRAQDFANVKNAAYNDTLDLENTKLRLLGALDSDQLAAMGRYTATIETIPGTGMIPLQVLVVGDRRIFYDFVDEFLQAGGREHLPPIRRYGEGSNKRLDAEALTTLFVANGFAEQANGNLPARWLDRAGGLRSIGIEE